MTEFRDWGDYWWPGQYEECLHNILHLTVTDGREIHDPDELARYERQLTTIRAAELIARPGHVAQTFTTGHYHALHRWLFHDVYEWAGSPRVVTTVKGDSRFADPEDIDRLLDLVHDNLGDPARFRTTSRDVFLDTLTHTFTGLLMIHPHLEGNGRTSRLYLQQIAQHAGYAIDWNQIPATQLVNATIDAFRLEPDALHRNLQRIVHPLHETDPIEQLRQRMHDTPLTGIDTAQHHSTPQQQQPGGGEHRTPTRRPDNHDQSHSNGPEL